MDKIKLIIFDLDGTLVDAYAAISKSFNYTMQKLGYPKQPQQVIRKAVGWGDENLLKPFVKGKDLKQSLFIYRRHHRVTLLKYSHLYPKVKKILSYLLSKRYKLAVASNRPARFSLIIIRKLHLSRYFDYVLCADRLRFAKPHPQILNRIMQKFSVKPAQALYIGDMIIDAQAGRRAGVKTIIVTTGSSSPQEIKKEKPYLIIRAIGELLKIL